MGVELHLASFANTLIGALVGGLISFLVSNYYFKKASKDLYGMMIELRTVGNMIVKPNSAVLEDEDGKIIGRIRKVDDATQFNLNMNEDPDIE